MFSHTNSTGSTLTADLMMNNQIAEAFNLYFLWIHCLYPTTIGIPKWGMVVHIIAIIIFYWPRLHHNPLMMQKPCLENKFDVILTLIYNLHFCIPWACTQSWACVWAQCIAVRINLTVSNHIGPWFSSGWCTYTHTTYFTETAHYMNDQWWLTVFLVQLESIRIDPFQY